MMAWRSETIGDTTMPQKWSGKINGVGKSMGSGVGSGVFVFHRRPVCKRPRPEMMHEAIAGPRQRESDLPGFGAQDVGIEQAQIGPRLQFDADLG
jgi:hypothetical protein